jgi:hypothetical protein
MRGSMCATIRVEWVGNDEEQRFVELRLHDTRVPGTPLTEGPPCSVTCHYPRTFTGAFYPLHSGKEIS